MVSSPLSSRSLSMSRTVSAVEMCDNSGPIASPHRCARSFILAAYAVDSVGVDGSATPFQKVAASVSLAKHLTGELACVPRGSQAIRSNRPSPHLSMSSPPPRIRPTPVSPGPPGSRNIVPIRWSGLLANCLITARLICSPPWSDQSNGTGTLAHSSRSPQDVQAIPVAAVPELGDAAELPDVVAPPALPLDAAMLVEVDD